MGRKMAGFEIKKVKLWSCLNCGGSGTAANSKELSAQLKAHREASAGCDESKKPKGEIFPPRVPPVTESDVIQSPSAEQSNISH